MVLRRIGRGRVPRRSGRGPRHFTSGRGDGAGNLWGLGAGSPTVILRHHVSPSLKLLKLHHFLINFSENVLLSPPKSPFLKSKYLTYTTIFESVQNFTGPWPVKKLTGKCNKTGQLSKIFCLRRLLAPQAPLLFSYEGIFKSNKPDISPPTKKFNLYF